MIGALIGDFIGSHHEFTNNKSKDFEFLNKNCFFTDDSVHTIAMAEVLMKGGNAKDYAKALVEYSVIYPDAGYGGRFRQWYLMSRLHGEPMPAYDSFGNGSAMRTSPIAHLPYEIIGGTKWRDLTTEFSSVTHNHPEGIKGAIATVHSIILANSGRYSTGDIGDIISNATGYSIEHPDDIRDSYLFNETCQETVPQAIGCFVYSNSFEDAIRNAISLGGDADTLAAITGSIAYPYYKNRRGECPTAVRDAMLDALTPHLRQITCEFIQYTA